MVLTVYTRTTLSISRKAVTTRHTDRTLLLTLGRLPVALELARAFHASGWRVVVAEPHAWHLCRLSKSVDKSIRVTAPVVDPEIYLDELVHVIDQEAVTLVLPVSEEVMHVAALISRVPDSVQVMCMDQTTLLSLHDKYLFTQWALQLGLAVPDSALASRADSCAELLSEPHVIKPRLSCSGVGVRIRAAGAALLAAEKTDRHVVQQKMAGPACSTFTIATHGKPLVSVCYKSLLESGSVSVCFEQISIPDSITSFISHAVQASNYTGMISFDFMQDDHDVWRAIECNPRATSGIHFLAADDIHTALMDGVPPDPQLPGGRRQEFWSSLQQVEGALFKGRLERRGWANLFSTRDITWRWSDMKPFLLMSFVVAPHLYKAIKARRPLSEIFMTDVGWHDRQP